MRVAIYTERNALSNARLIYTSVQASARVSQRRLRRSRTRRMVLSQCEGWCRSLGLTGTAERRSCSGGDIYIPRLSHGGIYLGGTAARCCAKCLDDEAKVACCHGVKDHHGDGPWIKVTCCPGVRDRQDDGSWIIMRLVPYHGSEDTMGGTLQFLSWPSNKACCHGRTR